MNQFALCVERGLRAIDQQQFPLAQQELEQALSIDPKHPAVLNLLGVVLIEKQNHTQAAVIIERALKLESNDEQAWSNLGLAKKELRDLEGAERAFRKAYSLAPTNPKVINNLASLLSDSDRPGEAITLLDTLLQAHPNFANAWCNLAMALKSSGQFKEAHQAALKALRLDDSLAQSHNVMGEVLKEFTQFTAAKKAFARALELNAGFVEALVNLGNVERELDNADSALGCFNRALEIDPSNASALTALGVLQEQLGDRDSAAHNFERAIEAEPYRAMSHYQLAQIKGRKSSQSELDALLALWKDDRLTQSEKLYLGYALFRVLEQFGRSSEAFVYLEAANAISAQANPYNDREAARYIGELIESYDKFNPDVVETLGQGLIFVVGMPRSGTTLTDQIISSHPEIESIGEVSLAFDTVRLLEQKTKQRFPLGIDNLSAEDIKELQNFYLGQVAKLSKALFVVDKTPLNFQYLGLFAKIFPSAKFIHCHRNPVDNLFSIYKLPFSETQSYAHDLAALGTYYQHYWRLMNYWRLSFEDKLIDVCYEDTVQYTKQQTKRMMTRLEMSAVAAQETFYQSARLVRTPSASQVREPIYKSSVGAWEQYKEELKPLLSSLENFYKS